MHPLHYFVGRKKSFAIKKRWRDIFITAYPLHHPFSGIHWPLAHSISSRPHLSVGHPNSSEPKIFQFPFQNQKKNNGRMSFRSKWKVFWAAAKYRRNNVVACHSAAWWWCIPHRRTGKSRENTFRVATRRSARRGALHRPVALSWEDRRSEVLWTKRFDNFVHPKNLHSHPDRCSEGECRYNVRYRNYSSSRSKRLNRKHKNWVPHRKHTWKKTFFQKTTQKFTNQMQFHSFFQKKWKKNGKKWEKNGRKWKKMEENTGKWKKTPGKTPRYTNLW